MRINSPLGSRLGKWLKRVSDLSALAGVSALGFAAFTVCGWMPFQKRPNYLPESEHIDFL